MMCNTLNRLAGMFNGHHKPGEKNCGLLCILLWMIMRIWIFKDVNQEKNENWQEEDDQTYGWIMPRVQVKNIWSIVVKLQSKPFYRVDGILGFVILLAERSRWFNWIQLNCHKSIRSLWGNQDEVWNFTLVSLFLDVGYSKIPHSAFHPN